MRACARLHHRFPLLIAVCISSVAFSPGIVSFADDAPSLARVSGTVRDTSGAPLAHLLVEAHTARSYVHRVSSRTDAEGRYTLELWPNTHYWLSLADNGVSGQYAPERHEPYVAAGATTVGLDFTFTGSLGLTIDGVLLDHSGNPVAEANVSGFPPDTANKGSLESWAVAHSAQTGSDGRFCILGLAPEDVLQLRASKYPIGTVESQPIAAGATGIELRFEAPPRIEGRVVDGDGNPVSAFEIVASRLDPVWASTSSDNWLLVSDPDGRFAIEGKAGMPVGVTVRAPGFAPTATPFDEDSVASPLQIVMPPERRISGTITTTTGTPVAGAHVCTYSGQDMGNHPRGETVTSDAEGRYVLGQLAEGTYTLLAYGPGLESAIKTAIDTRSDSEVDWTLKPAGSITLRLTAEGRPVRASVSIRNHEQFAMFLKTSGLGKRIPANYMEVAETVEDGSYISAGLPEGTYYLEVSRQDIPRRAGDSIEQVALIGDNDGGGAHRFSISLAKDEHVVRDIDLSETNGIVGAIIHDGLPVPAARIDLNYRPEGDWISYSATTDASGRYVFSGVASGTANLRVTYHDVNDRIMSMSRSMNLSKFDARQEDFDNRLLGTLCGTCRAVADVSDTKVLVVSANADLPPLGQPVDRRLALQSFNVASPSGAIFREYNGPNAIEAGEYQLVALDQRGTLLAGPIDIEIRPGEITRVDF